MIETELCITTIKEAVSAKINGFARVELCSALEVGGLTPGYGLIKSCVNQKGAEVHVMIRPRPGNFIYDFAEINTMLLEIEAAKSAGANGVVFGLLNDYDGIDKDGTRALVEKAKSLALETTFHRAFDLVKDPRQSLDLLLSLRIDRLLTSGLKPKAIEGIQTLRSLVDQSGNKIEIMAGSGINAENVQMIRQSGVHAIHFSAFKVAGNNPLNMGDNMVVDIDKIQSTLKALEI